MMVYALVGILIVFLIFLFVETRNKALRLQRLIAEEKRQIAEDSGMTASLGVFSPDIQTTVIIGASEQLGIFYYRMLRQARVIIKSRINLANLAKIEFLLNGKEKPIPQDSEQLTLSLRATDIADRFISEMPAESIRQIDRAAIRIIFYDETGLEKTLEITAFRAKDERQRFDRVQLIKNAIWWVAFLQMGSRQARRMRALAEEAQENG